MAPMSSMLAALVVGVLAGAAAQPVCPDGTALVWKWSTDFDAMDPTAKPVASASCVKVKSADAAVAALAASDAGATDTLGAPTPATSSPPVDQGCPPGTTAVDTYQDTDIMDPTATPTVTTTCLPIRTTPRAEPLVTMTLDGGFDTLSLDTPTAEPCSMGTVRLTPSAATCTPW